MSKSASPPEVTVSTARCSSKLFSIPVQGLAVLERDRFTAYASVAICQRRQTRRLCSALDRPSRTADDDCLQELRWLHEQDNSKEARADERFAQTGRRERRYPRLAERAEDKIGQTLAFYRLPIATPAPHAHEEHEAARAFRRGDQATHAGVAHLSDSRLLPAAGARAVRPEQATPD